MKQYDDKSEENARNSFDEILRAALTLPPDAREVLADLLYYSLDSSSQEEIDEAWREEIDRRVREVDEGLVELVPGEEVMAKLRSRFKV